MGIRRLISKLFAIELVWVLNASVRRSAAAMYWLLVRHYAPIHQPEIAWWAIAIAVLVCERWPVELEFRRSSHSFSLTDVPMTLALVFSSGTHAFIAVVAGSLSRAGDAQAAGREVRLQPRAVRVRVAAC